MSEKVFVRRVSGVIKTLGFRDTIYYGFLTGAGLYWIGIQLVWGPYMFPGGDPWIAILLVGVFSAIVMVAYAMLASAMPRSGGDYVFQSRGLNGVIGFLTAQSNMTIWNMFYSYSAGFTVVFGMLSPLFSYLGFILNNQGLMDTGKWMTANPWTTAGLAIVLIVAATLVMYRGMMPFIRIQRYFMAPAAFLALVVMVGILLSNPPFVSNFNWFASSIRPAPDGGWYANIIKTATDLGYNPSPGFSWWDTMGLAAVASPPFLYCGVTAALLGEIKGAESLKRCVGMFVGASMITFITYVIAFAGVLYVAGMPFVSAIGFLSFEHADLLPLPVAIFAPLPGYMLTSFLSLNPVLTFLIGLGFLGVISQSLFNSPIGATRTMFAAAIDRVLPEPISRVNRYGTPWNALLVIQTVAILFAVVLTAAPEFAPYWAGAALSGAIMFVATMAAATLLPYTAKGIHEVAPCSKHKIGKIPAITIFGVIGLAWSLMMAYMNLAVPGFGLRGIPLYFAIGIYVVLAAYYYIAKWYRKRQGIYLELCFKEVPPA
jgi:amino acid transporter